MDNKYIGQFKKGSLEMVLLHIISRGETYGYEILTRLNKKSGHVLGFAREGTIYPILYRLEKSGFISSRVSSSQSSASSRKFYSITPSGQELLNGLLSFWEEYKQCIDDLISADAEGGTSK